jgi:hypothetical protein
MKFVLWAGSKGAIYSGRLHGFWLYSVTLGVWSSVVFWCCRVDETRLINLGTWWTRRWQKTYKTSVAQF